jgi:tRNA threonylcarbamoyladenosine biosynthesis protein TsaB
VAAVRGPGSFTGLRVGLAAAQGLCLAAGLSGAGVETTAAIAWASDRQGLISVLLDGGHGRLFAGRHRREGASLETLGEVEDLSLEEALERVAADGGKACVVRGDRERLSALFEAGAQASSAPLAAAAAELATLGLATAGLEPLYVRAPAIRPRKA